MARFRRFTCSLTPISDPGVQWNPLTQTFIVDHTYLDDESGMQDDVYPISATVTEGWMPADGDSTNDTTSVSVANRNPEIDSVLLSSATIDENGSITVNGSFSDIGSLDMHTVMINWGNGQSSPATVNPMDRTFLGHPPVPG